jgi:hypothetical protein
MTVLGQSGNVGIGTMAPDTKLTVAEDTSNTGGIGEIITALRSSTGTVTAGFGARNRFVLEDAGGNLIQTGGILSYWVDPTIGVRSADTQIQSSLGNAAVTVATFTNQGNVGIGTTSPASTTRLQIQGSGATSATSALNVTNSTPTSLLFVRDDGNVGINTTTPLGGKLHLYNSTGIFEGPSSGASVINSNTFGILIGPTHDRDATASTYYPGIAFNHLLNYNGGTGYNVAPQGWIGLRLVDTTGSERSSLVFATKEGTGTTNAGTDIPTERMCITPFGNVGIGTTSPNIGSRAGYGTLTVRNNSTFGEIEIAGNTSTTGAVLSFYGDTTKYAEMTGEYQSSTNGMMVFRTRTSGTVSEKMRITSAGDVGIGTTSPSGKLDISASASSAWMNLINANEEAFRLTTYNVGTGSGSSVPAFKYGLYYNTTENAVINFYRGGSSVGGFLTFTTDNGTERMRIDASGNVGIGNANPGSRLVVKGVGTTTDTALNVTNSADTSRLLVVDNGNIGISVTSAFGNGVKVIGISNATTVPNADPSGGGVLYVEAGALKYRGSSGTITTIAPA